MKNHSAWLVVTDVEGFAHIPYLQEFAHEALNHIAALSHCCDVPLCGFCYCIPVPTDS